MKDALIRTIIAGLFFGMWPLLMNRSGLAGNLSSAAFAGIALLIVLPFAVHGGFQSLQTVKMSFVVAAGIAGGIGLLAFNGMLARVTREQVGMMFVIMIMVQATVPVVYHIVMTGDYSLRKLAGILAAFVAIILLG